MFASANNQCVFAKNNDIMYSKDVTGDLVVDHSTDSSPRDLKASLCRKMFCLDFNLFESIPTVSYQFGGQSGQKETVLVLQRKS
jgi:hypothetical protein